MLGRVEETLSPKRRRFRNLAWGVLIFNVLVVLGGAIVRATGSGDGCGASWPRCTDRLFPANPGVETIIEFSHRVTSGLAIVGVVVMFFLACSLYDKGHRVRGAAGASLAFLLFESLLGAALVLTPVRWLLLALPPSIPALVAAQCGHAVTFAVAHLAGVQLVQRAVPATVSRRAQALYSGMAFGLGMVAGAALAGPVYSGFAGAGAFLAAAGLSTAVALVYLVLVRRLRS